MHLQHTLLLSTLAFWGGSAVAQLDLPAIQGGSLLPKRLEKAARRARIENLPSDPLRAGEGEPMEPTPASDEKRSFQLGNVLDGLLGGSSGSSTPAASSTPTPSSSGNNMGLPNLPVVKKDLGGLGGLGGLGSVLNEVPGLSPQGSSASPTTPSTSATPANMKRQDLPFPNDVPSWPSPSPSFRVVKKQLDGLGGLGGVGSEVEGLLGMSPSSSPSAGLPLVKSRRQDDDMGQDDGFLRKERREGVPELPELPKLPVV